MNSWITLPQRRVLALSGPEHTQFLQGLITQDIQRLQEGRALFSALLTAQGRFQSDFFLIPSADGTMLFLEHHESHTVALKALLERYQILSDVTLQEVSYAVCVALGDEAPALCQLSATLHYGPHETIWYQDPRHPAMGVRALVPYEHLHSLPHTLLIPKSEATYHHHRLALGLPEGAHDLIPGKSIILEYAYHHLDALSWDKGCYLGQELMARTYHRGQIHKRPYTLRLHEGTFPACGETLMKGDEKIGIMGSHCGELGLACLYSEPVTQWASPIQHFQGMRVSVLGTDLSKIHG